MTFRKVKQTVKERNTNVNDNNFKRMEKVEENLSKLEDDKCSVENLAITKMKLEHNSLMTDRMLK